MKRCCLLFLMAIMLAACAGVVPSSIAPTSTPIAPPDQADVTPTVVPDPLPISPDTVIVYQREGGFVGTSEKWTIYPTGRIVSGDGGVWQVPLEQVAPLFNLVESPDFGNLSAKYPAAGACDDCYVHAVMVYDQGTPKTVIFSEGADLPALLQQLLSEINKAITR